MPVVVLPPADLVAVVRTAAVPDIPFASLAGSLAPVRDAGGNLVDWVLSSEILQSRPAGGDVVRRYWEWRRRWEHRQSLGPLPNVVALVGHTRRLVGEGPGPLDDLFPVEQLLAGVDVDVVIDLDHHADVLEEARQLVVRAGGTGLGFVDLTHAGRAGFARTWPAVGAEQVMAATGEAWVVAGPGAELRIVRSVPQGEQSTLIQQVDLAGEQAAVTSPSGEVLQLPQTVARVLAWVVPGSLRWRLRTIDLVVVWAEVFRGMLDAMSVAAEHGGVIRLTASVPLR